MKPIIIGFLLCIFSNGAMMLSVMLSYQTVNIHLEKLSAETGYSLSIEEIRANYHAILMSMMRYRETNNSESAENCQEHINEIHRIRNVILSNLTPHSTEMVGVIAKLSFEMEDIHRLLRDDIQIGELLALEETTKLLADRKEIRNRQNRLADEIESRLDFLASQQQDQYTEYWQTVMTFHSFLYNLLIISCTFVLVFNMIVFIVVIRLASRNASNPQSST